MSIWPTTLNVGPIREWPGNLTPRDERRPSPFSSTLTSTMSVLDREIYNLADTAGQQQSAEVLVAIPIGAFTKDNRPYARAIPDHPGVIFSMETKHGRVSYPADSFTTWQDNLRAIALALEALRKVDRYGVTKHGEQYRGFLALETGGRSSVDDAVAVLSVAAGIPALMVESGFPYAVRLAKRRSHPDAGGTTELWNEVAEAEGTLRDAGLL